MILCKSFSTTVYDLKVQPVDADGVYTKKNTLFKSFSTTIFDLKVGTSETQKQSIKNTLFKSFVATCGVIQDNISFPFRWMGELVEAPSLTPTPPIVAVTPVTNMIYRNSVDTLTYIYNGSAWVLMDNSNKPNPYLFPALYKEMGWILRKK